MPDERHIEKKLRAAAEKRRREAGAPFAMHPATRRMLQGEVQRVHGRKSPAEGGKDPIFSGIWLRFASVGGTMMILAVASWFMFFHQLPPRSEPKAMPAQKVAKNTPALAPAVAMPESASAPALQAAKKTELAAAPPPVAAPAVTLAGAVAKLDAPAPDQSLRFMNNATVAAASARRMDTAGSLLAEKSVENATRKPAPASPVLNSFQLEQRGEALRIVDGDGSVYTGQLLADATADKDTKSKQVVAEFTAGDLAKQSVSSDRQMALNSNRTAYGLQNQALMQNATFRATGTNRSLQQNIIINAQFFNGRVVGRATLADGRDVPLDAAPTNP